MICVHNVVAASAAVGLSGKEGDIIRKTLIPAFIYGLLVGVAGFVFISIFFDKAHLLKGFSTSFSVK